jgi:hypothetical protein
MHTTVLAAAAALVLVLGPASGFAAGHANGSHQQAERSESSNVDGQCDNILANPAGHSAADLAYCRGRRA